MHNFFLYIVPGPGGMIIQIIIGIGVAIGVFFSTFFKKNTITFMIMQLTKMLKQILKKQFKITVKQAI
jgi:hypothetical protein